MREYKYDVVSFQKSFTGYVINLDERQTTLNVTEFLRKPILS